MSYPTFDDDPAKWGLKLPEAMTEAEAQAASGAEAGTGMEPYASYPDRICKMEAGA
jgi:hypothetical protein